MTSSSVQDVAGSNHADLLSLHVVRAMGSARNSVRFR
jgi:hypothetical protein